MNNVITNPRLLVSAVTERIELGYLSLIMSEYNTISLLNRLIDRNVFFVGTTITRAEPVRSHHPVKQQRRSLHNLIFPTPLQLFGQFCQKEYNLL